MTTEAAALVCGEPDGKPCTVRDCPWCGANRTTPVCEGHVETRDEDYARLLTRYGDDSVGFVAELAKKNSERKLLHQVLTSAGIPSETPEGRGLCLLARVAIMADRLTAISPECGCGHRYHGNSLCTGTVGSMSDGDEVFIATTSWGWNANDPCVCVEYVPQ